MKHGVGVIGLGIMGQRMLAAMAQHPEWNAVAAWDPDARARAETAARYPGLRLAADAAAVIADPGVALVYVASPPARHAEHARAALAAGKGVYCEKPLGVDLAESRALVDAAERAGAVNLVNFSLASAAATRELERRLGDGSLGELLGVDVRLHFPRWPRAWQQGAHGWLAHRAQGGMTREVLSHWIYLIERLLGPARLDAAAVRYPEKGGPEEGGDGSGPAETQLLAQLSAGAVPVSIAARVGGAGPEQVECTFFGAAQSARVFDWQRLALSSGGPWAEQALEGGSLQLDNAAAACAGAPHTMPSFRDALSVQSLIEAMLARRAP